MRNDLSYCMVDGHAIFLDLSADRYFRLPEQLEQAFVAYANGSDRSRATEAALVERNILTREDNACRGQSPSQVDAPLRSAFEAPTCRGGTAMLALPEVMAITWQSRRRLRTWPLRDAFNEIVRYRTQRCPPATPSGLPNEQTLLQAVGVFRRARRYVPIETRCLLDSISLFL